MKSTYIVSANGYYFEVQQEVNLEKLFENACYKFDKLEDMYNFLCETYGYALDEVIDCEMFIKNDRMADMMRNVTDIKGSIEDFIINFEM